MEGCDSKFIQKQYCTVFEVTTLCDASLIGPACSAVVFNSNKGTCDDRIGSCSLGCALLCDESEQMEFVNGARALDMNSIPLLMDNNNDEESTMDPVDESERTERKRQREKDRRSELSRAFDVLGAVLNDLDPTPQQGSHHQGGSGGKKGKKDIDLTRLDKLHRTTALLRRMHRDMVGMQRQIAAYEQQQQQQPDRDDGDKVRSKSTV
jgi:hypothetical protein